MNNTDKPAFTILDPNGSYYETGLTKREYFAGLAMQGMLSNSELLKTMFTHLEPKVHRAFLNLCAIEQADDLLKQLEETK